MSFPTEKIFERDQRQAFLLRLVRKIFLEDWTMKLVALIITIGLWLGVTGLRTPTSRLINDVPLSLRLASDLTTTNSPVTEVTVKISGDKSRIDQINKGELTVSVDLSDVPAGDRTLQLTPQNVYLELPAGFKLEEIQPSRIAVRLERVIERDVPVKAETEGGVADNFEIYSSVVTPTTVRVSGPESFVRPLDSISTEKINVESKQEDFTARQVSLNVISPQVRLIDTTVVDVFLRIGERRVDRTIIMTAETEKGPRKVSFRLKGPRSAVDNLVTSTIDVQFGKEGLGEAEFSVVLPPELRDRVEIMDQKMISKP
jgi:YbbR domain-containing protein